MLMQFSAVGILSRWRVVVSCVLINMLAVNSFANDSSIFANKTLQVCKISPAIGKPVIDGKLDEIIWQQKSNSDLYQLRPVEYGAPSERTEFWLCYDDEYLYFAAQAYMKDPSAIVARQHIQGFNMDTDDQIHISIDPFHKQREGYFFQVNPNGMRNDVLITNTNNGFTPEWNTIWHAQSAINDKGWATEIKIPFKSLAFNPANSRWGFNVGRVIRANNELIVWNSLGAGVWEMGPVAMGDIEPLENLEIGKGVEIVLSAKQREYRNDINATKESDFEPAADIFYRPKPAIGLAATINTDFSATEVDDRIVNLTRFNVFLPEKRDFFLQDNTRFLFGDIMDNGLPFTSRRIGLDTNGKPLDIDWGLKAAGVEGNTGFGLLAVEQSAADAQINNSQLFVARLTQNILPQLTLGAIYTQGNPVSSGHSHTAGFDILYDGANREDSSNVKTSLWYQQTSNPDVANKNSAYGLNLFLPESSYDARWNFVAIERNFNPALGFVNRTDMQEHYIEARYKKYFSGGFLQSYRPDIYIKRTTDFDNELLSDYLKVQPLHLTANTGDALFAGFIRQTENVVTDYLLLPEVNLQAGHYEFDRRLIALHTADSRRLFSELEYQTGDFYSGSNNQEKITLGIRPVDRVLFKLSYDQNHISLNNQSTKVRLVTYKHEVAITDTWAWLIALQYDNQSRMANMNSRLRWIPEPGREMYLVFNKGALRSEINDDFESVEEEVVVKFSYNLRF